MAPQALAIPPMTVMLAGIACAAHGVRHPPTLPTTPTLGASVQLTAQEGSVSVDSTVPEGLTSRWTVCQVCTVLFCFSWEGSVLHSFSWSMLDCVIEYICLHFIVEIGKVSCQKTFLYMQTAVGINE